MDGYPKIKYHIRGGGSICVTSAPQEKALGDEWIDNKPFQAVAEIVPVPEAPKPRGRRPTLKPST